MRKLYNGLSARASNVLTDLTGEYPPSAESAALLSEEEIRNAKNCGKATAQEIKEWLAQHKPAPAERRCPHCGSIIE